MANSSTPLQFVEPKHVEHVFVQKDEQEQSPASVSQTGQKAIQREATVVKYKFKSAVSIEELEKQKLIKMRDLTGNLALWSISNQKKSIPLEAVKEIERQIEDLIFSSNSADLVDLLDIISRNLNYDSLRLFSVVLNELLSKAANGILLKYMEYDDLTLTPLGISELLKIFEVKYSFTKCLLTCEDSKNIPRLIQEVASSSKDSVIKGCIIYDSLGDETHVTPIFIQKKDGKIQILVTDSVGQEGYQSNDEQTKGSFVFLTVVNFLNKNADKFSQGFEVYTFFPKRQRDRGTCSLYSLMDLKNLLMCHQSDIFEFIQVNGRATKMIGDFNKNLQVFEFQILPPDMMKETQSISQLNEYEKLFSTLSNETIEQDRIRIEAYFKILHNVVKSFSRVNPKGKLENRFMDKKRMKIITILCKQVLKYSSRI